ncbi:MAG: transposase [Synergistaceae bacterium]|nr:transposase [Synergistaceae bacterium]
MSCGGRNTKIHAIVDALGNPVELYLTPGNENDCRVAIEVLSNVELEGSIVMGDKAYGTKEIREYIENHGASYCIPPKSNLAYCGKITKSVSSPASTANSRLRLHT